MAIKRDTRCESTPDKRRYPSERLAIASALGASRRGGLPLRVYRCPDCKGWHLTKRPAWHPSYGPKPKTAPTPAVPPKVVPEVVMSNKRRRRIAAEQRRAQTA